MMKYTSTLLLFLLIFRLSNAEPLQQFINLTKIYYEARGIDTVTFFSCHGINENFVITKQLSAFGIRVKILTEEESIFSGYPKYSTSGIVGDWDCENFRNILHRADERFYFRNNFFWLVFDFNVSRCEEDHRRHFNGLSVYPMSEIALVSNFGSGSFKIFDVYKVGKKVDVILTQIGGVVNSSDVDCDGLAGSLTAFGPTGRRRKNLQGIYLNCALVISFPDLFTRLDDLRFRHIDTLTRGNYPTVKRLAEDVNFQMNLRQLDNYGWNHNGTFDGLMGLFQRQEIEVGALAVFMRDERIPVVDWTAETYAIKACILFRQPPLSAVSNIFLLPFTRSVWIASGFLFLLLGLAMLLQCTLPSSRNNLQPLDMVTCVWGSICQQGFYHSLHSCSGRILVFFSFISALFLFTSYSANIVALLQSPSNAIKSISDLVDSPLKLLVQDTIYNHVYFNETTDPIVRKLYTKKIRPQEKETYIYDTQYGMRRIRYDFYAFQVETQTAYQIMSDTFDEHEKCGVKELEAIQLPMSTVPLRKHSPYKELFTQRLRWQRENGLMKRDHKKFVPQKPKCMSNVGAFVSVGLMECRPALVCLLIGMACALTILLFEVIVHYVSDSVKREKRRRRILPTKSYKKFC